MKKAFVLTLLSVFSVGALSAFPVVDARAAAKGADGLEAKIEKAVMARKKSVSELEQAVLGASVTAKNEIARLKEPNFSMALQSLVKVMDAHNDLRKVSASAAASASFEINAPFKAGWGETLTVAQFVNRESVVLPERMQAEFDAWAAQLAKDVSNALNAPAARETLDVLAQARKYIGNMKEYNGNHILQSLTSVMDAHNDLRKANPALAALVSREINKPIKTGFGGSDLVVSRFVHMESVMVYGNLQHELDSWAAAIERDLK